ncbi:MAG: LacI family DNA-binding transcriptional regulator [Phycisphaerales bacterium]|nr:LacI family DNA-binding transcriptional regulator [Phycisphaerales bacterium]
MAGLERIADRTGVSIGTVSRILRDKPIRVAPDTRAKVLEVAAELGYRPNLLVRAIQSGKTGMIGVMVPPFDSYWAQVLYGIHDCLTEHDHVPLVLWAEHQPGRDKSPVSERREDLAQIYRMIDRRIDGAILWPFPAVLYAEHMSNIAELSTRNIPIVTIDHELDPQHKASFVGTDEAMAGAMVARHLLSLGHRRFGHFAGRQVHSWAVARRRGFEEALRVAPDATCISVEVADEVAEIHAMQLLNQKPRPTAIFAATDHIAEVCYRTAAQLGLVIPRDLSVVGCGNLDIASWLNPPLTSVRQQPYLMGRRAAEIVVERSRHANNLPPIKELLPTMLELRSSTSAPLMSP